MRVITAYYTDKGNVKKLNQDSLSVKVVNSPAGKIIFAVVCDGMGGLEQGELASREVVIAMNNWFAGEFAKMVARDIFSPEELFAQWQDVVEDINVRIGQYAAQHGIIMGTTLTALLVYKGHYYICHVGDSRIYALQNDIRQMTLDHTVVAEEVRQGRLSAEAALVDPRRSILLQCVGASEVIETEFETGEIDGDTTFLVVSDGFVHKIKETELKIAFAPHKITDKEQLSARCRACTELIMDRKERDNITVVAVVMKEE